MKLKFKIQDYQTKAVESVINCFQGQPNSSGIIYRIDPGSKDQLQYDEITQGFKNHSIVIDNNQILSNVQKVQRNQNLPQSQSLFDYKTLKKEVFKVDQKYTKQALDICKYHFDIEMETGTGKTYCYIKSMFELNKQYGWTKFIIVVPSIAIREGVYKSLEITADHFQGIYHKKATYFIYNSNDLSKLNSFSSDAGIQIMIINVQAFNSAPKQDASLKTKLNQKNKIYRELDDFQSRCPIDVIKANNPILIMDEPQKMGGDSTLRALKEFRPLFILRYSATHNAIHNKIHRLDALDAYNQKLVKKISVRGISIKGLSGTSAYLYLESIEISKQQPVARIEMEIKQKNGIKRIIRKCKKGDSLYELSGHLEEYKGFLISDINANSDTIEFTNGKIVRAGEATGNVNESTTRRIQIREAIRTHLQKEQVLFQNNIKVLTLFFIDEVAKYRVYTDEGEEECGEYAKMFEEEYANVLRDLKTDLFTSKTYWQYLTSITAQETHNGYFAIDKKNRMVDPKVKSKTGETDDVSAYDLILKDKERLLSFQEPTRFIFSHSALREGWDNPNVFVICTLKNSSNITSRRQEVGRGLRISVNQNGERQDNPATVHQTNVLTVVASESYKDFVTGLQRDISESLSERPRVADEDYFTGKIIATEDENIKVTPTMAKHIYRYLIKNDYTDDSDHISPAFYEDLKQDTLAPLPNDLKPYKSGILKLIENLYSDANLPEIEDERKLKTNSLNANYDRKEFKELWTRINKKAVYSVHFDSNELIKKCIAALNKELRVSSVQFSIQTGEQKETINQEQMKSGTSFEVTESSTEFNQPYISSDKPYDLLGKIAENTQLTRRTVAKILTKIDPLVFSQFKTSPEMFISQASRLIQEQKATVIVEHISYDMLSDKFDEKIFTESQTRQDFSKAHEPLHRHIYNYLITDSKVERNFAKELDTSEEVVVYAKLPKGFYIPTPVGDYNPDWAIAFKEGTVKHIYFVAETKGSMSSMELREIEKTKIECARKFFDKINKEIKPENIKYDVVNTFSKLMDIVGSERRE